MLKLSGKNWSLVETIFALMLTAPLDSFEAILGPTGLSTLIFIPDVGVSFIFVMWFLIKGDSSGRLPRRMTIWLVGNMAELVMIVEMLPIRTVVLLWAIHDFNKHGQEEEEQEEEENKQKGSPIRNLASSYIKQ